MRSCITGSQGFIGSHLKEALLDADGTDIKLGRDIRGLSIWQIYDRIFHFAAKASIPASFENPKESWSHNVFGTIRILEHARQTGAHVILSSSSSIYGDTDVMPTPESHPKNPVSPYAQNKLECEWLCEYYWKLGVKSVALRYFNVFGEGQEMANGGDSSLVLATFLNQYKNGEPFTIVGDGTQRRDFIYVGDVVQANLKAAEWLETADHFESFNIGSGSNISINDLADLISKDHPRVNIAPRQEPHANMADVSKTKELLNWEPTTSLESWINSVK